MLVLASIVLSSSAWVSSPSCPPAFSMVNTSVGAISNSSQLSLCVSKATLVKGSNGSVNLVLGAPVSNAPRCLVYPNGLSLDLTFGLLSSGHVGCWSLYPPYQPAAIVNVGRPSQTKLQAVLKSFRPDIPRIFMKPENNVQIATNVLFSSSAKTQVNKTKLLTLPAEIRFKPIRYRWGISQGGESPKFSSLAKPTFKPTVVGDAKATLAVTYSIEYSFTGLTNWTRVRPDILSNASPFSFKIGGDKAPEKAKEPPRLVTKPCELGSKAWRC